METRCLKKNQTLNLFYQHKNGLVPALKPVILIHSHLLKLSCLLPPSCKKLLLNLVLGPHHQSRAKWEWGKSRD